MKITAVLCRILINEYKLAREWSFLFGVDTVFRMIVEGKANDDECRSEVNWMINQIQSINYNLNNKEFNV